MIGMLCIFLAYAILVVLGRDPDGMHAFSIGYVLIAKAFFSVLILLLLIAVWRGDGVRASRLILLLAVGWFLVYHDIILAEPYLKNVIHHLPWLRAHLLGAISF